MSSTNKSALRESLQEQLRFEKLAAEISARFINLDSEDVEDEIERVLGLVGESLGGGRCFNMMDLSEEAPEFLIHTISHTAGLDDLVKVRAR